MKRIFSLFPGLVICALLGACASSRNDPTPVQLRTKLTAAGDVNPDAAGRASPLVVRVYGLRTDPEFNRADFFALYDREKESLAASLTSSQEYVLQPGETRWVRVPMPRDARYVAVVAAYRDIRGSRWRMLARAPRKSWTDAFSRDVITIGASRTGVTLAVAD
jgi:type VI secretion system protein VasD